MHEQGYLHRDIKRGNVFIHRENGTVKAVLGDLGLAFPIDTHPEWRIAVPDENCSPEVLLKNYEEIDRRKAETYSLGIVFYIMLFHEKPTWHNIIHQDHLSQVPQSTRRKRYQEIQNLYEDEAKLVSQTRKGVRSKAVQITFKMLHPDPLQRISLASALNEIKILQKKESSSH